MSKPITVYVDVDDTLVRTVSGTVIPIPSVVRKVKALYESGAMLYCWSAGGAEYAQSIAERLGITECFQAFLPKPTMLLDDQTPLDWPLLKLVHPAECDNTTDV